MTRWLNEQEQEAWRAFLWTAQLLQDSLDRQLRRDSGIPQTYYMVLVMLSESPGRCLTMSRLAEATKGSASRLSHAVARLEERGWIRRAKHPEDGRTIVAELTDEGFAALEEAAPGHVTEVRRVLFDQLTPEQVAQLSAICHQALEILAPEAECES